MKKTLHLFWLVILEMGRTPTYLFPTLIFPAFFYSIFAIPEATNAIYANLAFSAFCAFGVFGVVFFQFGVGIADERYHPWGLYFRTLPISPAQMMIARAMAIFVCAVLVVALIMAVGYQFSPIAVSRSNLHKFLMLVFLGAIPLALMGIAFGFWVAPKSALPLGVFFYLPLSYLGGLLKPPDQMPEPLSSWARHFPTGRYGRMLWDALSGAQMDWRDPAWLAGYGVLFLVLAWWGYRRDDLQRFR